MATLSDTPTQTILTSAPEAGGVSIKIEQGVLPENDEYIDGSGCHHSAERRGIQANTYESSTSDMESLSIGMGGNNVNAFQICHSIFQENIEIKAEPSVDIDDRYPELDEDVEGKSSFELQSPMYNDKIISPKIRLTPTSKLIATPTIGTNNKRRYACPYENCTKSYGKSSHLRSHLTWHTGIKPFVCQEQGCGKGFTRSDELNRHIRTHTGEKPFECVQCTKKFSRSDHLSKHLATHNKQLVAANELAKKIKIDKSLPQSSVKTNSNSPVTVTSSACEIITDHKEVEENALKIKLENPDYDEKYVIPHNWDRTEISSSPGMQSVNANIKIETEITIKPEPIDETQINNAHNQYYDDEPDDDAIMPEANLPPLIQNVKPPKVVTPVKSSLKRSTNAVYDPTRPHSCTHCTKSFKRQDDLNRHMRTHTGEKPFACSECEKRFMRSDHLKKHINTHIRMYKNLTQNGSPAESVLPTATQQQPSNLSIKLEPGD